ncbi:MAG: class I SAM-dependent methyltransferase [Planctomycetaceae bacterium]|nr:class I SAM-dependent methyltransferase [Planctomycetaceae bacterium]
MSNSNDYSDGYCQRVQASQAFIGNRHQFFIRLKAEHFLDLSSRHVGDPAKLKILDFGCGIGLAAAVLAEKVAQYHGIDISQSGIERARAAVPQGQFISYEGKTLPYRDNAFDAAFSMCVFHHIPPQQWTGAAGELMRVVRPGGLVALFDHNPWNPLTRLAVARCDFDQDATLLRAGKAEELLRGGDCRIVQKRFILLTPFDGKLWRWLDFSLGNLPLGAQYCIAATRH